MTDEEILKKAIEKAVKNGYDFSIKSAEREGKYSGWTINKEEHDYFKIIFSHNFAKAFWNRDWVFIGSGKSMDTYIVEWCEDAISRKGEKRTYDELKVIATSDCKYFKSIGEIVERWQYHLQQMVLEENPIKYLEKFL